MQKAVHAPHVENREGVDHVPIITCPDTVKKGTLFPVTVSVGEHAVHPSTADHHIRWVSLLFKPKGDNVVYQVAHCEFKGHQQMATGSDMSPVFTDSLITILMSVNSPGTIFAMTLCNIHGIWDSTKTVDTI